MSHNLINPSQTANGLGPTCIDNSPIPKSVLYQKIICVWVGFYIGKCMFNHLFCLDFINKREDKQQDDLNCNIYEKVMSWIKRLSMKRFVHLIQWNTLTILRREYEINYFSVASYNLYCYFIYAVIKVLFNKIFRRFIFEDLNEYLLFYPLDTIRIKCDSL